jgi:hypothetical protein
MTLVVIPAKLVPAKAGSRNLVISSYSGLPLPAFAGTSFAGGTRFLTFTEVISTSSWYDIIVLSCGRVGSYNGF